MPTSSSSTSASGRRDKVFNIMLNEAIVNNKAYAADAIIGMRAVSRPANARFKALAKENPGAFDKFYPGLSPDVLLKVKDVSEWLQTAKNPSRMPKRFELAHRYLKYKRDELGYDFDVRLENHKTSWYFTEYEEGTFYLLSETQFKLSSHLFLRTMLKTDTEQNFRDYDLIYKINADSYIYMFKAKSKARHLGPPIKSS